MRYFFNGKIEKLNNFYLIRIPFNVWEVSKHRDIIKAEMWLDEKHIDCELLPIEKGNYNIHLEDDDVAHVDMSKNHDILLRIPGSLIQVDQNSPYSFEHPIRKIDKIDIIIQPEDGLCGQTCVAMLAGVTIDDVAKAIDCREWQATMGRVISALNYYGIAHSQVIMYTEGKETTLPKCCIMMEKMGRFCHYLVHFDGKYYDSNLGIMDHYDMHNLLGYLEVNVD